MRRLSLVTAALATAVLLSGCDGGSGGDSDDDPTGAATSDASTAAEPEEPTQDLYGGRMFDRLPDGDPELLSTVEEEKKFPTSVGFIDFGGVVFGDDVAVLSPETQLLTAVDLATGDVRWQQRLPRGDDGEPEPLCPIAQLPPGATVVTVMTGIDCATFRHFDLETGKLLDTEDNESLAGIPFIHDAFSFDRHTYWIDEPNNLYRLEGDGTSTQVLPAASFGLLGDEDVASAMPIVGSNTVLLGTIRHDVKNPISDSGRYLGLQIPAEGDPEVTWSEDVRPSLTQAQPGSPYVRGSDTFIKEDGGSIVSAVRPDIKHPRLNRPDPETGAFDSGLVLQRDPEGGLPAWAESLGKDDLLPLTDGMVASSGAGGFSGYANLSFYDYGTNKIRWSYDARLKSTIASQQAEPVGVSSDGKYVYAMVTADLDSRLVELDAETGKKVRSWTFPDKIDRYLDSAEVYVHDDVMIWLARFDSPVTKMYAAVFKLSA